MKVITNGREYTLKLKNNTSKRSSLHQTALGILTKLYGMERFYNEVRIPGTRLFMDIFSPTLMLCTEVHGAQHFTFNSHFHKTKADFYRSKKRDQDKINWCEENKIDYISLRFDETELWEEQIRNR